MIVAPDWLRDFVNIDESPQELADMLTMLGMEAESLEEASEITNVVTARINKVSKHPNADKLHLCEVTDGSEIYSVVCGAPNVRDGQITAFAKVGAALTGGFKIKPAKIRGEKSFGMLCSQRELGMSEDHSGIIVLPGDTEIGQDINALFPQPLQAIEFDITPNRPDCLSHYGIAREIALKAGRELKAPVIRVGDSVSQDVRDYVDVELADPKACPRYIAGIVKNIKVGPSPDWMARRLEAAGMRPINNVVDISNYVLLEMGHPTHIFDYKYVPNKKILVRHAGEGEKIVTLDEEERTLNSSHLLITDGEKPVAIAGIMGGERSGVSDDTTTVLIESAYFDPVTVRKGSKSLGLITESSRRFERGADPQEALPAFWRIVNLLEDLAGGEHVPGIVDAYPEKITMDQVTLRKSELDLLSGCDISDEFVEKVFDGLEIEWTKLDSASWLCTPPTFRPDLEREVDLIEEVIRVYGYDNIPSVLNYTSVYGHDVQDPQAEVEKINSILTGIGFRQCFSNSLQSEAVAGGLGINPVKLVNPLSEEMSTARTSLLPGLLQSISHNVKNGSPDLQLFELGQVFKQKGSGFSGVKEYSRLTAVVTGLQAEADIHSPSDSKHSFYSLRGALELLISRLKLSGLKFTQQEESSVYSTAYAVKLRKQVLGTIGILNSDYVKTIDPDLAELYALDIDLKLLLEIIANGAAAVRYTPISVYPRMERDLNFVLDEETEVETVLKAMRQSGGSLLISVRPKDIFRHKSIGENLKSITFRFVFQHPERTLEDKEVTYVINEIIAVAEKNFNAKLRT